MRHYGGMCGHHGGDVWLIMVEILHTFVKMCGTPWQRCMGHQGEEVVETTVEM